MSRRRLTFSETQDETWGQRARKVSETDLDITPMIDVTFLLLIFFMVTSTMQATPDLDVPIARHGVGLETRSSAVIQVKKPETTAADTPIVLVEDDNQIRRVSIVELEQFVAGRLTKGIHRMIVKADRDVPHGLVQQVTRAVTNVEGAEFSIGVRDAPGK